MAGIGTPHLLLPGGASPHAYALKPSDARRLARARIVFWIGPSLETFLARSLCNLTGGARRVALIETKGLVLHRLRARGVHRNDRGDDHGDEHDHDHAGDFDPHIWLDPANAVTMAGTIADALAAADPPNTARYQDNARRLMAQLEALRARLARRLAVVKERPFVTFHDAYRYFEARFGLNHAGAITLGPERSPGARRIAAIRARIRAAGVKCVFIEPQFSPRMAATVIEGSGAVTAVLDPLGADIAPGPGAYVTLIEKLADAFAGCLGNRP
jgi:zinc transport system substrate-binding protein